MMTKEQGQAVVRAIEKHLPEIAAKARANVNEKGRFTELFEEISKGFKW